MLSLDILVKIYENQKYFIFDDSCVKVPHTYSIDTGL